MSTNASCALRGNVPRKSFLGLTIFYVCLVTGLKVSFCCAGRIQYGGLGAQGFNFLGNVLALVLNGNVARKSFLGLTIFDLCLVAGLKIRFCYTGRIQHGGLGAQGFIFF